MSPKQYCVWYLKLFVTPEVIYCEQCNVLRTIFKGVNKIQAKYLEPIWKYFMLIIIYLGKI